ncbi:hypothetical protein BGZ60DRAFT_210143 [Tricladium varicosporioides]|nr:hypothetical protein BGZ60DRAFT_210143 [Hymenoscyphus varicosporioides]
MCAWYDLPWADVFKAARLAASCLNTTTQSSVENVLQKRLEFRSSQGSVLPPRENTQHRRRGRVWEVSPPFFAWDARTRLARVPPNVTITMVLACKSHLLHFCEVNFYDLPYSDALTSSFAQIHYVETHCKQFMLRVMGTINTCHHEARRAIPCLFSHYHSTIFQSQDKCCMPFTLFSSIWMGSPSPSLPSRF